MAHRPQPRRRLHSCTLALLIVYEGAISPAAEQARTTTRVRSEYPLVAAAIATAAEYSPAFRAMVEAVEKTDGIVYVRVGTCRRGLRACLTNVHSAPSVRFVHVAVDTRKAVDCELMGVIGHELQHALEVLGNPKIVDDQTLQHFYMREGATGDDNRLETESADHAGLQVEKELHARSMCRHRPGVTSAESARRGPHPRAAVAGAARGYPGAGGSPVAGRRAAGSTRQRS